MDLTKAEHSDLPRVKDDELHADCLRLFSVMAAAVGVERDMRLDLFGRPWRESLNNVIYMKTGVTHAKLRRLSMRALFELSHRHLDHPHFRATLSDLERYVMDRIAMERNDKPEDRIETNEWLALLKVEKAHDELIRFCRQRRDHVQRGMEIDLVRRSLVERHHWHPADVDEMSLETLLALTTFDRGLYL